VRVGKFTASRKVAKAKLARPFGSPAPWREISKFATELGQKNAGAERCYEEMLIGLEKLCPALQLR
jgi:hypothetical protein